MALKFLYSFFRNMLNYNMALHQAPVDLFFRVACVLLLDESKAIRLVWDVYSTQQLSMYALWTTLRTQYAARYLKDFSLYHARGEANELVLLNQIKSTWDRCSRIQITKGQVVTLLSPLMVNSLINKDVRHKYSLTEENTNPSLESQESPLAMCRQAYETRTPLSSNWFSVASRLHFGVTQVCLTRLGAYFSRPVMSSC